MLTIPLLQKCSCWIELSHETFKPHTAKATQMKNFHNDQIYDCHSFKYLSLIFVSPFRLVPFFTVYLYVMEIITHVAVYDTQIVTRIQYSQVSQ